MKPTRRPSLAPSGIVADPECAPSAVGDCPAVALTVGKFDGVHAGHRHILAYLAEAAYRRQASSAALVLHPDPVTVLAGQAVGRLTSLSERCHRLRDCGVAVVEPLLFTREVAELDPEMFVARLTERFDVRAVVVGSDFAFGYNRAGNLDRLREIGSALHFDVIEVPPLVVQGGRVSSRRIRAAIASGDIALARTLLRQPPRFRGTVVHGVARGRGLGYPTANVDPEEHAVLPGDGVYVVRAEVQTPAVGIRHAGGGLLSIGVRPTFDHGPRVIEVHLLDFQGDLYGSEITIELLGRLRGEQRFADAAALVAQLKADVLAAERQLADESAPRFGWTVGPQDDREITVRGRDLAELLESAALAVSRLMAPRPCTEERPLRREHWAPDEGALWDAWLACIVTSIGPEARIMAYHAGEGSWHALWLTRCPEPGAHPLELTSLEAPHAVGGLLEARLRLRE